jgi:hypothetical protein
MPSICKILISLEPLECASNGYHGNGAAAGLPAGRSGPARSSHGRREARVGGCLGERLNVGLGVVK